MSKRNIQLSRRLVDAFNAHDLEALLAYFDPSIELHSAFAAVDGAVYHGHDELRTWYRGITEVWGGEIRLEPEAYFDLGEQTLAFQVAHGRGNQSGAAVSMPLTMMAAWRDGLVVYFKTYVHKEDALCDLRVSEDALERIEP
jgi:ketosteroid isomerase-like protein